MASVWSGDQNIDPEEDRFATGVCDCETERLEVVGGLGLACNALAGRGENRVGLDVNAGGKGHSLIVARAPTCYSAGGMEGCGELIGRGDTARPVVSLYAREI